MGMDALKIFILFSAVFLMETVGMIHIQRSSIRKHKQFCENARALFPLTRNRMLYYLVSLVVGAVLVVVLVKVYPDQNIFIQKVRMALLYGIMCPIAQIDFCTQKIPNRLLIISSCVWVITIMMECIKNADMVFVHVKSSLVAAIMVFIVCIICKVMIKNSIGMGDIKLFMVMGLFQGTVGMSSAIFVSLIVSFFCALALLLLKRKQRKDNISFGPFILIGTTLSMFLTGV